MGSDRAAWAGGNTASALACCVLPQVISSLWSVNPLCSPVGQEGDHGRVLSLSLGLESCVLGEASRTGTDSSKASPLKIP